MSVLRKSHLIFLVVFLILVFTVEIHAVKLKAGAASVVITNEKPRVMVNGRVSNGKLHDIYARALVLNDGESRLVILTYDLNCLDVATPILRQRVQHELGIDSSKLILLATHNHRAPIQIVPDNFDYGRWLSQRLFNLVKDAIDNERGSVKLFFGHGYEYSLMAKGNAPVDYEIQVLKVVHKDKPIALLFNQATHPLASNYENIDIGHPGYAIDKIESKYKGLVALYADACGGNQFPKVMNYEGSISEAGLDRVKAMGHKLAKTVLKIAEEPMEDVTGTITSKFKVLSLPLAPPISREQALELAKEFPDYIGFVPYPESHRKTNWVRMLLRYYELGLPFPTKTTDMICTDDTYLIHNSDKELLDKYDYSIHDELPCKYEEVIAAKIGSLVFVAMQGEVCAPIGMRIKDAFRQEMPVMVFAYMGEHNLYIPTHKIVKRQEYQAKVIQTQYASPVGWAPEVEDEMVNGVIEFVNSIVGE